MKRKNSSTIRIFAGVGILLMMAMLGACAPAPAKEPIKIGLIEPLTGGYALSAAYTVKGFQLAFDEVGYKVAGRDIKIILEDEQGKPDIALAKAKKVVELDKVDLLAGTIVSTCALAIRDYVDDARIPFIIPSGSITRLLSGDKKSDYIWRTSTLGGQYYVGLATYIYQVLGCRKMVFIGNDYSLGYEAAEIIGAEFEQAGGELIQKLFVPLGTVDFAPYLTTMSKEADVCFAEFGSTDAVHLVLQYREYGMWKQMPLCGGSITSGGSLLAEGDAALGVTTAMYWDMFSDRAETKTFMRSFYDKYGIVANDEASCAYEGARAIIEAIKVVKGNMEDKAAFLEALANVQFVGPRGPFAFEKSTHSVIVTPYIRTVQMVDGEIRNIAVKVCPVVKPSDIFRILGEKVQ